MITPDSILSAIDAIPPLRKDKERWYLGASEIGHVCSRHLWLKFHRFVDREEFDPEEVDVEDLSALKQESEKARMRRLFQRGHDEELRFEDCLHAIGVEIVKGSREQPEFRDGFFSGHSDGILRINAEDSCAEYKTHNRKSFNRLKRGGLEESHPTHFGQCHSYMGKFGLKWCIYLAVCKDDDRLFCDVLEFDQKKYDALCAKAEFITMADKPPDRISRTPTFWKCKMCPSKNVCFGFELPRVHCRNCTSATKHRENGAFGCDKIEKGHDVVAKMKNDPLPESGSCSSHSFNPWAMQDMFNWQPIEFFPKHRAVKYQKPDGTEIINGAAPFGVESKEMTL